MDREIAKILDRLEELRGHANELGQKGRDFIKHIEAAEGQLEAARKELEDANRQKDTQ
ncbi:MAG TPA: hypothetical protein VFI31_15170 [Pirellulales bacterium]|nr:hypothetical protein [Pirellulales bacterium]